ncbi:unnamed protein product [Diamesa hyperborea]
MVEISENDCKIILQRELNQSSDPRVIDFNVEKIGSYLGFLGAYYRLKIVCELDGKLQEFIYFVKCLPTHNEKQKNMLIETGIFLKEVHLYQKLMPKLTNPNRWYPYLYLARDDLLVLDDLSQSNYKMLPFRYTFQKLHVEETLKALARFHASSIWYEETGGGTIGDEFKDILFETSLCDIPWCHAGLKTILSVALERCQNRDCLKDNFYEKLCQIFETMENPQIDIIKVLVHRDPWKNNLMFQFENDETGKVNLEKPKHCIFLDFQTVRYLSLTHDVLMAIYSNTRKDDYDVNMMHYLMFYYEQLKLELKERNIDIANKLNKDLFLESCSYFKLVALVFSAIVVMLTFIPVDYFTSLEETNYEQFMIGARDEKVLKLMDKDTYYSESMIEIVDEIIKTIYDL